MKQFTRFLAMWMAVVMSISLAVQPCRAAEGAVVTGNSVTAVPGETVKFSAAINRNPGLVSFQLRLRFDTEVFALEYAGADGSGAASCERGDFSRSGTLLCAATGDGCTVLWTHVSNVSANGTLFELPLRVREDAPPGEYPIEIEYISQNTVNQAEERVPLSCIDGKVAVRAFAPTVYGEVLTAKPGGTLDYAVYLRDNPGIASYDIRVQFDNSVLSLAGTGDGSASIEKAPDGFSGGGWIYKPYLNGAEVFWHSAENSTDTGALFVIHFKVSGNAPLGTTPVTLSCVPENTLNTAEEPVSFLCKDGAVAVQNVDVSIQFTGSNAVSVHVTGAEDRIVIAALYSAEGRMVGSKLVRDVSEETFTLRGVQGLAGGQCKVMILDTSHIPVCPPFCAPAP